MTVNTCGKVRGGMGPFAMERHRGATGGCSHGPSHGPDGDMYYWTAPEFFADRDGFERINIPGDSCVGRDRNARPAQGGLQWALVDARRAW